MCICDYGWIFKILSDTHILKSNINQVIKPVLKCPLYVYYFTNIIVTSFHRLGGLNAEIYFLTIFYAKNLKSRRWQHWFLPRTVGEETVSDLSPPCRWLSSPVFLHALPSFHVCVQISFCENIGFIEWNPNYSVLPL